MRLFSPHKAPGPGDVTANPQIIEIITNVIKLSAENVSALGDAMRCSAIAHV